MLEQPAQGGQQAIERVAGLDGLGSDRCSRRWQALEQEPRLGQDSLGLFCGRELDLLRARALGEQRQGQAATAQGRSKANSTSPDL